MLPTKNLRRPQPGPNAQWERIVSYEALTKFDRAYQRARWARWLTRLTRSPRDLLELGCLHPACPVHGRHSAGLQRVPIDRIQGTEGRSQDFDRDFNPLHYRNRDRWKSIYLAWEQGKELPPVELIRVGDTYYVRDGHHRISVAKTFGQSEIRAEVTIWDAEQSCSCNIEELLHNLPH